MLQKIQPAVTIGT